MDKEELILLGAVSGALIGLGLSFTALSPLVIGGIVAAVPAILFAAYCMHDIVKKGEFSKGGLFFFTCSCVASAAIGVGLAAAATTIFPGAMLGLGSAALAGATIGVIAPIAGMFATLATLLAAEKVNEYIISPIVERIFPSKGEGYE
ncbi:hypothetical protein H9I48_04890 [Wolbachia pipientis]|uniref:hypothetical protein n=1 Tax=Wolbachia pipientis TaxID=955 RepID=UPI001651826D|nr:hypothetical protein [Wolbachia pipientis]MBC6686539.1 hypothetical protein [Wolbachia pipientis]